MNTQTSISKNQLLNLMFKSLGIVAILVILFGVLLGGVLSYGSANWLLNATRWFFDSYVFVASFSLVAIAGFVLSGIFEFRQNGNKSRLYSRVGKITGILALIAIPSAPIIGQLFCTKDVYGTGCDLSSIGMVVYFTAAALVLAIFSIIAFILSATYKRN